MSTEILTKKVLSGFSYRKVKECEVFRWHILCKEDSHVLYENVACFLTELSEMSSWLEAFNFFARRDSIVTVFTNIYIHICDISFATRKILLKKKKNPLHILASVMQSFNLKTKNYFIPEKKNSLKCCWKI